MKMINLASLALCFCFIFRKYYCFEDYVKKSCIMTILLIKIKFYGIEQRMLEIIKGFHF